MVRKLLAVFAGFVVWSVLWFGLNAALGAMRLLPAPGQAVTDAGVLALLLAGSVLASLVAGLATASLAGVSGRQAALWLGVLLLAVGVAVQVQYWQLMPAWYHLAFLLLLVSAAVAGGRLRRDPAAPARGAG